MSGFDVESDHEGVGVGMYNVAACDSVAVLCFVVMVVCVLIVTVQNKSVRAAKAATQPAGGATGLPKRVKKEKGAIKGMFTHHQMPVHI